MQYVFTRPMSQMNAAVISWILTRLSWRELRTRALVATDLLRTRPVHTNPAGTLWMDDGGRD